MIYPAPNTHLSEQNSQMSDSGILSLVQQLNDLLQALNLPFPLTSPRELTPSLLIAILETLLQARITNMVYSSTDKEIQNVQNMKLFLGVLEHDVLGMDVGLSSVDPNRLVNGSWDEVVFIGELLCWVGRKVGLILNDQVNEEGMPKVNYQSTNTTAEEICMDTTSTIASNPTITISTRAGTHDDSETNMTSIYDEYDNQSQLSAPLEHLPTQEIRVPQCIHEVATPSVVLSDLDLEVAFSNPDPGNNTIASSESSVRYEGYIMPVDEEREIAAFESKKRLRLERKRRKKEEDAVAKAKGDNTDSPDDTSIKHLLVAEAQGYARTIELLNERARLLTELAALKHS